MWTGHGNRPWRTESFRCVPLVGGETTATLLPWSTMRFYVLGNPNKPGVREEAERLLPRLQEMGEVVAFDLDRKLELSRTTADMALVLGGDGAILRAARQMGYNQV